MQVVPEAKRNPPRTRNIPLVLLGVFFTVILIGGGTGLWFAGSLHERGIWEPKYETLDNEAQRLRSQLDQFTSGYDQIREEVNQKLGQGDDCKAYVTPSDASVAAKVFAIADSFTDNVSQNWTGFGQLYDWVVANIDYSSDSRLPILPTLPSSSGAELSWKQDYWRMPSETLEDETGDCEDMATLLESMMLNYTSGRYACWVIMWTSESSGHAAVAMPVEGGSLMILDPAGKDKIGFGGRLPVSDAVADWLGNWPSELGIHVSGIFSDTQYQTFKSTSEFLEWAAART